MLFPSFVSNVETYPVYTDWRAGFFRFPPQEHVCNAHGCHSISRDTSRRSPRPVVQSYVPVSLTPTTDPDQWGTRCDLENGWEIPEEDGQITNMLDLQSYEVTLGISENPIGFQRGSQKYKDSLDRYGSHQMVKCLSGLFCKCVFKM